MLREVYHITSSENIPLIKENGLLTLQQQSDEGMIDLEEYLCKSAYNWRADGDSDLINFYVNTLYFRPQKPPLVASWISVMVEESVVDVLNNRLEFQWFEKYMSSKMKFWDFLKKTKGEKLLHPITAQPINKDDIEPNGSIEDWQVYSPEIIIQKKRINTLSKIHQGKF